MPKKKAQPPIEQPEPLVDENPAPVQPDQETSRILRVTLTDAELRETSRKLADKATELNQLEEDKKRASSHFSSEVKAARGEITKLSQLVTSGYELREVPCHIWFHKPKAGQKITVRIDTGETIDTAMMTSAELQMRLPLTEEEGPNGSTE
jgi:hypothetical protein